MEGWKGWGRFGVIGDAEEKKEWGGGGTNGDSTAVMLATGQSKSSRCCSGHGLGCSHSVLSVLWLQVITPFDIANLQAACFGGMVETKEKNIWGESWPR